MLKLGAISGDYIKHNYGGQGSRIYDFRTPNQITHQLLGGSLSYLSLADVVCSQSPVVVPATFSGGAVGKDTILISATGR